MLEINHSQLFDDFKQKLAKQLEDYQGVRVPPPSLDIRYSFLLQGKFLCWYKLSGDRLKIFFLTNQETVYDRSPDWTYRWTGETWLSEDPNLADAFSTEALAVKCVQRIFDMAGAPPDRKTPEMLMRAEVNAFLREARRDPQRLLDIDPSLCGYMLRHGWIHKTSSGYKLTDKGSWAPMEDAEFPAHRLFDSWDVP